MDPLLQYGPNDAGGFGAIRIALFVIGALAFSWLFGAGVALISNYAKGKQQNKKDQ